MKGDPCYIVQGNLVALCITVMWKAEFVSSEFGYLAEISKQNIKDAVWFLLADSSKMQEKRNKLREELLSKKEPGLDDLRNYQTL